MASLISGHLIKHLPKGYVRSVFFSTSLIKRSDVGPVEINNPFEKEKQECILCSMDISPNYKNIRLLSQFQSPYTGKIFGRHITGLCKEKQELVEKEIVKAQSVGYMGSYHKSNDFLKDPKLFDSERPIRPHKH